MVKRILLASLFLFMPLFANGMVIGSDINEKNIPLNLNVLDSSFEQVFDDSGVGFKVYKELGFKVYKERFYNDFYANVSIPFSMKDLFNICVNSTKETSKCTDFVKVYMNQISKFSSVRETDLNEKNLSLDVEKMDSAFEQVFDDGGLGFKVEQVFDDGGLGFKVYKERFYNDFYANVSIPFSMKDLFNICVNSTKETSKCTDFVRIYSAKPLKLEEVIKNNI